MFTWRTMISMLNFHSTNFWCNSSSDSTMITRLYKYKNSQGKPMQNSEDSVPSMKMNRRD